MKRTPMTMLSLILTATLSCASPQAPTAPTVVQEAATASVDAAIARGRALLDDGQAEKAEAVFAKAHEASGGAFETNVWVLRAWMDQGRSNDTLDAIDALAKEGHEGPTLDYLYGMAFARRAEQAMMAGRGDAAAQMNFGDAVRLLTSATAAEPQRFSDGFLALATSAWYSQDLETARTAVDAAVQRFPKKGEANLMRGRIALSQFQVSQQAAGGPVPDAWEGPVLEHWTVARDSFADAVANFGKPKKNDARTQNQLSQAAVQLGHTWVWKGARDEAAPAYGTAIAWAPDRVNLGEMKSFLTDAETPNDLSLFLRAVERGQSTFAKTFGKSDPRNASLLWWKGYAQYWSGEREESEESFLACLELEPGYSNSWVYIGLVRSAAKKYDESIEAFRQGWEADPVTTIREVQSDGTNADRLRYLISHAFNASDLERAGLMAELVAESTQTVSHDWNNLGLFLRDRGEALERNRKQKTKEELALIEDLFERSYRAYDRALKLVPKDPQVMNDTAVILHYYLERDLEKARTMYVEASQLADAELENERLSKADRERFQVAQRDAGNNLRALDRLIEARAKKKPGGSE